MACARRWRKNWTEVPTDWQQLRWQWEVSHAVNAVIAFAGFCSLVMSALVEKKRMQRFLRHARLYAGHPRLQ
jgi:hypothetical protein